MVKKPPILYHYCSLDTFQNIVTNKSIWLSDISKSNDSTELIWLQQQVQKYLSKTRKIDRFNKWLEKESGLKTWCFCLSEAKDSLEMWRGYAQDASGIAIGFNSSLFDSFINKYPPKLPDNSALLYSTKDSEWVDFSKVEYSCEPIYPKIDKIVNETKSLEENEKYNEIIDFIPAISIQSFQHKYKNPSFLGEKEWRLSVIKWNKQKSNNDTFKEIYHHVDDKNSSSHIEIDISIFNNPIAEIWLGPKSKVDTKEIANFLCSNGFDLSCDRIKKSISSYR